MADDDHIEILKQGVDAWNAWRGEEPEIHPDLSFVNLEAETFDGADFRNTNFFSANLSGEASFCHADFRGATFEFADLLDSYCARSDFRGCLFVHATLSEVDFSGSDFRDAQVHSSTVLEANFSDADLRGTDFNYSNLSSSRFHAAKMQRANLTGAQIVECSFSGADLTGASVFAVTPWKVDLEGATQRGLVITPSDRPPVTVDDLELAQFVHMLLDNRSLRRVIDTMATRAVLVLGVFGKTRADRLAVLQTAIRARGYLPLTIDISRTVSSDLVATTTLLARLARYVVADFTNAPQILQLLEAFVPEVAVPVLSLDSSSKARRVQFADGWKYAWYLGTRVYKDAADLAQLLKSEWLAAADAKWMEIQSRRQQRSGR